ncbi:metallophosphoesterase family protein [Candidatus Gracilibacteria bacterium]|nr:metallophosphoesterase family protein [Candidatus Gracilibacteria bacterium]
MNIILVSDSHGRIDLLEKLCEKASQAKIKHIIHAGDLVVYDVEKIFAKYPDITFHIAKGNADVNEEVLDKIKKLKNCMLKEVIEVEFEGVHFAISHIEGVAQSQLQGTADVFCHGHTHRAKQEERDGFKVLNPGALCEGGGFFLINLPSLKIKLLNIGL